MLSHGKLCKTVSKYIIKTLLHLYGNVLTQENVKSMGIYCVERVLLAELPELARATRLEERVLPLVEGLSSIELKFFVKLPFL